MMWSNKHKPMIEKHAFTSMMQDSKTSNSNDAPLWLSSDRMSGSLDPGCTFVYSTVVHNIRIATDYPQRDRKLS